MSNPIFDNTSEPGNLGVGLVVCYSFDAQEGDLIDVFVDNLTDGGARRVSLQLLDRDGVIVLDSNASSFPGRDAAISRFEILNTGTYTLLVDGVGDTTGDYTVGLTNYTEAALTINDNQSIPDTLTFAGDGEAFTFDAQAGDLIDAFVDNFTDGGARRVSLELLDTDGVTVLDSDASSFPGRDVEISRFEIPNTHTDTDTGTYTLLVDGVGDTSGDYTVSLSFTGTNDNITGTPDDDILGGGAGNDTITGLAGNDNLTGGADNDLINGNGGRDTLLGGSGQDTLNGQGGPDFLDGGTTRDILRGGSGNDTLRGGAGNDNLFGNNGNDNLLGQSGKDRLFGGAGKDSLLGGGNNDTLNGGANNDTLKGGNGDDVLLGGTGIDRLFGNDGSDTFVIKKVSTADRIIILDYTDGIDVLGLSDGLTFGDLSIQNNNANTATLIKETSTNNTLAVLSLIDSSVINLDDVVSISGF